MQLTNEQANRIYAAFGLNAVAVKQAAQKASEGNAVMDARDSHVLAMLLGWMKAHHDPELAESACVAFGRLLDVVVEAQDSATEQEGGCDG
jgi:hypothetical protein